MIEQTEFKKMAVSHLDKTFFISNVSKECFNNSLDIENTSFFDVFKIKNDDELNFRIKELKKLGYTEDKN